MQPLTKGQKMENSKSEIRIYVACLAAYNAGILHGCWIDAVQDWRNIQESVNTMLKASPEQDAEEWVIHDYEGFGGYSLSEWESFDSVATLAEFITEHEEIACALLAHYNDLEAAKTALNDHFYGTYESVEEFAEELTTQTTDIPESLTYYIDYGKMARDMEINDILVLEANSYHIHIFGQH